MKHFILLMLGFISACAVLEKRQSAKISTLFTVAEDTVVVDEFLYAFQKNRPEDSVVSKAEIDEYLELYKKFKLKVAEAKSLGMDTTEAFREEYTTYMGQLDNSYLQSGNDTDSLTRQAYDRMQYQINASHILLLAEPGTPPADTLAAYNKLLAIRDSVLMGMADFGTMAQKYSEDPSAKQNQGSLGFFSVFQMVYPFENAAYETQVGNISEPFRTRFGFHIVKVNDKRPNEGKIRVAHIMVRGAANAEEKIYNLYNQLQAGGDWEQLCAANSEDFQSANRGGELTPFSRGQIVEPFSSVAFGLNTPGEISEPIQTPYGWHIIKLIEKLSVADFDKMQQQLSAQVRRDDRSKVSEKRMLERLAAENNYVENSENVQLVIDPENHQFTKNVFAFTTDSLAALTLFTINGEVHLAEEFFTQVNSASRQQNSRQFLFEQFNALKSAKLIAHEKAHLAEKYPEYKYLKKEYHDGILLFSIMEEQIWNPASTDTTGIKAYYEDNKVSYLDSTTVEMAIFSSSQKAIIDSIKRAYPDKESFLLLSKSEKEALSKPNNDTAKVSLQLEFSEFDLNGHPILQANGVPDEPVIKEADEHWFYLLPIRLPGEPRRLANIRGRLIADYQEEIENKWVGEISKKYPVIVDEKALKFVYKKLDTE